MNTDLMFSSKKQDWETPQGLFNKLHNKYNFELDAAASDQNAKVANFFTEEDDALKQDWGSFNSIFCNPPYSTKLQNAFIKKAYDTHQEFGNTIVLLIPARTGTMRWHKYIFGKAEIKFIEGRLHFETNGVRHKINAPFDSAVVVYGGSIDD